MGKRKRKMLRPGQVVTGADLDEMYGSLTKAQIDRYRRHLEEVKELPEDLMDWPAKWLARYYEQGGINWCDNGGDAAGADRAAEGTMRELYRTERFEDLEFDLIFDSESWLPDDVAAARRERKRKNGFPPGFVDY